MPSVEERARRACEGAGASTRSPRVAEQETRAREQGVRRVQLALPRADPQRGAAIGDVCPACESTRAFGPFSSPFLFQPTRAYTAEVVTIIIIIRFSGGGPTPEPPLQLGPSGRLPAYVRSFLHSDAKNKTKTAKHPLAPREGGTPRGPAVGEQVRSRGGPHVHTGPPATVTRTKTSGNTHTPPHTSQYEVTSIQICKQRVAGTQLLSSGLAR